MFCNVWVSVQLAYDNGLIDRGMYDSGAEDVKVELERWPHFREAVERWMALYPQNARHAIFAPLNGDAEAAP